MATEHVLDWSVLFTKKGTLKPGAWDVIQSAQQPYDTGLHLAVPSQTSGIFYSWKGEKIAGFNRATVSMRESMYRHMVKLALSPAVAMSHTFSCVKLPSGQAFWHMMAQLKKLYVTERLRNPLGSEVFDRLMQGTCDAQFLLSACAHAARYSLAHFKDGEIILEPLPQFFGIASGIYLIEEYEPGSVVGTVVYAGMSVDRLTLTIKDHFRNWPTKANYWGVRGENRGEWHAKLAAGYTYSVRILQIPLTGAPRLFRRRVFDLETMVIHLFDPRDNDKKRVELDPSPVLFNAFGKPLEQDANPDDDLPF